MWQTHHRPSYRLGIYPTPPPDVDSLALLVEGLVITDKYNIGGA